MYEIVIGLEVHVQLKTKSKMFCGCKTTFGSRPNTQVCPVCLGLPGVLPVINKQAFDYALKAALALNCRISDFTKFDRKNYFYPDLPKNYQISQYDIPLAKDGYLDIQINAQPKRINLTRVHLEEDAGKLVHPEASETSCVMGQASETHDAQRTMHNVYSLVDFNRTGVPLLEIVSEPEINSPEEAHVYLTALKEIMQYLGISDCDMEKGSLRCDANLSIRPRPGVGAKELGVKVEIKNINSFKFVRLALEYEARRQAEILKQSGRIIQETRGWDEHAEETRPMRSKEEAHDYRYFPEPDLEPIRIDAAWLNEIKKKLPELPQVRRERFTKEYQLPEYDAGVLTQEKALADYFEECLKVYPQPKSISNWIMGEILRYLKEAGITIQEFPVPPARLVELIELFDKKEISSSAAKDVFKEMIKSTPCPAPATVGRDGTEQTAKTAADIINEKGLRQVNDESVLTGIINRVIEDNPKMAADYRGGKESALMALVGQVMRASQGKANPQKVKEILISFLK